MKNLYFILVTVWILSCVPQIQPMKDRKTSDDSNSESILDLIHTRLKRSKDSKACQPFPNMDDCKETLSKCCENEECVLPRKNLKYKKDNQMKITRCTHNLSNWTACCQSCFDYSPLNIKNNTETCDKFTSCKVEYMEVPCKYEDIQSRRAGDSTTGSKPAPRTRIIAFSIAGIVMIALLAFAGHSISNTREKVNFQFPNHSHRESDGEMERHHTVVYHQQQNGGGGASKYFYHPPNAYPRPNGRLFIGSTLSIIQEEEDVIVTDTEVPTVVAKQQASHYPDDLVSMTSSSCSYSSASGEYNEVVGGSVPSQGLSHFQVQESDDDGVTHIEIQDLDSVQGNDDDQQYMMTSRGPEVCSLSSTDGGKNNKMERNCVICDVHASPCTSSTTSLRHHQHESNYSLGAMLDEMPDYDIASMSMYDVTNTSPVQTQQRRISQDHHFLYVSMPDMTKATSYIPEIDELLTSSSSSSSRTSGTPSSSCSSEYCLSYR